MGSFDFQEFDPGMNPISLPSPGGGNFGDRIGDVRNPLADRVEQLETQVSRLQNEKSNLEARISTKENTIAQLNEDLDTLLRQAREAVQAAYDKGVQDVIDFLRARGII